MDTIDILGFQDPFDSWSHLLGAIVLVIFLINLFRKEGVGRKQPIPILIYGISGIFLLSMSGVYHLLPNETTGRYVLRILDHAGIFLLIAGTIIAVHLVLFSGLMKWGVIILASVIATVGITLGSIYFNELPSYMTHTVFLAFGWLGLVSGIGVWKLKKSISIKFLVYGGLAYTIGAVIDWIELPVLIPGFIGPHQIFHLAVLIGITYHWIFLLKAIGMFHKTK